MWRHAASIDKSEQYCIILGAAPHEIWPARICTLPNIEAADLRKPTKVTRKAHHSGAVRKTGARPALSGLLPERTERLLHMTKNHQLSTGAISTQSPSSSGFTKADALPNAQTCSTCQSCAVESFPGSDVSWPLELRKSSHANASTLIHLGFIGFLFSYVDFRLDNALCILREPGKYGDYSLDVFGTLQNTMVRE